jgi:hypothetical protein
MNDDVATLLAIAEPQDRCITRRQLLDAGYSDRQIARLRQLGIVRRILHGVYVVAQRTITRRHAVCAALLARRTALEVRALLKPERRGEIWIAVTNGQRRPHRQTLIALTDTGKPATIRYVRANRPVSVETVDGFPTASVPRALVDVAATTERRGLPAAIREADFRSLLHGAALGRELALRRPGSRRLRDALPTGALLGDLRGTVESRSEHRLIRALLQQNLPAAPVLNATVRAEGSDYRLDAWWVASGYALEVDGPQHRQPQRRADDERRDAALATLGIQTRRIATDAIRADLAACVNLVICDLAARSEGRTLGAAPVAVARYA